MLKNILGSIVFVAAVLALVNFVGDVMVKPASAPSQARTAKPEPAMKAEEAVTAELEVDVEKATAAVDHGQAAASMVASGQVIFKRKCAACHPAEADAENRIGPNLWEVAGREKGSLEGFRYSKQLKTKGGVWDDADLNSFIAGPRTFIPDTKMTFAGIKSEKDRMELIAYLKTLRD